MATAVAMTLAYDAEQIPAYVEDNRNWKVMLQEFDGVRMVFVPHGCLMGRNSGGHDDEHPIHRQCFRQSFWIDETEVTQDQFVRLGGVKAIGTVDAEDGYPVFDVAWEEARSFCERRRARLPTEREWEYAARGPWNWLYPWGDGWQVGLSNTSGKSYQMVGLYPAGKSWVGALDMIGNMAEWVYAGNWDYPYKNRQVVEPSIVVLRGGSWFYPAYKNSSTATRRVFEQAMTHSDHVGFRCVRSAS